MLASKCACNSLPAIIIFPLVLGRWLRALPRASYVWWGPGLSLGWAGLPSHPLPMLLPPSEPCRPRHGALSGEGAALEQGHDAGEVVCSGRMDRGSAPSQSDLR